jgi:hypothetical protein
VQVHIAGPPFGDAKTIDEAKERFRAAWLAFKAKHTAEELAAAYDEMNHADRPDRYLRSERERDSVPDSVPTSVPSGVPFCIDRRIFALIGAHFVRLTLTRHDEKK